MPQVFRMGSYLVYFWSDECNPLEPVHVHVSAGEPTRDATKIWLTKAGGVLLENNASHIPVHILRNIMDAIEAQHEAVRMRWLRHFGEIRFYC